MWKLICNTDGRTQIRGVWSCGQNKTCLTRTVRNYFTKRTTLFQMNRLLGCCLHPNKKRVIFLVSLVGTTSTFRTIILEKATWIIPKDKSCQPFLNKTKRQGSDDVCRVYSAVLKLLRTLHKHNYNDDESHAEKYRRKFKFIPLERNYKQQKPSSGATTHSASQEIPTFFWGGGGNPKVYDPVHKSPPLDSFPRQINTVHNNTPCFFEIRLDITSTLPSKGKSVSVSSIILTSKHLYFIYCQFQGP
jgi:hypothetical protein